MLRYNLKLILRNLWGKKIYTSIILLSLIVAFVCSNILISFLTYETDTDSFHSKKNQIFQIFSSDPFNGDSRIVYIPSFFSDYLTENYAEIEEVTQLASLKDLNIEVGKNTFRDFTVLLADKSFFSIFDFPIVYGNRSECLAPGNIVISEKKAEILFGKSEVVGQPITVITPDSTLKLMVSAVTRRPSVNSHLNFDAIMHNSTFPDKWHGGPSYALLTDSNLSESLEMKINNDINRPGLIGPGKINYFFGALEESYFRLENKMGFMKTRNPTFLKIGYIACLLVIFIAGFNFINLFLLFWQERKKEVGIKKTLGISKKGLFGFSITEAGFYILVSFIVSLGITILIIPVFNSVFEYNFSMEYLLNTKVVVYLSLFLFVCGVMTVMFSVSKQLRIQPVNLMAKESSRITFNRFLFTVQFIISIILAICSITLVQQMNFLENASLGFNRSIIQLDAPSQDFSEKLHIIKQNIASLPFIDNLTVSGGNPITGNMISRYELDNGKTYTPFLFGGDEDFLKTLDLTLLEGELPSNVRHGKLVNQKLIRQFNLEKPIGKKVPGTEDIIIGVVQDFTCGSFKEEIPPVIISYYDTGKSLLIDYQGNNLKTVLPMIEKEWSKVFSSNYFKYSILEEELRKKYKEDTFFFKLIVTFSIISILLSCFGLFALSWAVTQNRSKEMGIRKVLGATSIDILNLLTITFTRRILIAFIIAIPIGYYLMNQWLMGFANKIELNFWIFAISVLIVIVVSSVTLSLQVAKTMMMNPINEIRKE